MRIVQKILVIEDEPSIADNIIYALNTDGFEAIWSATGHEGVATLKNEDIELVILDIGLPDGSGFEFCKEIRKQSDVPIIFLTARKDEIDRVVGLEIGGDDYVVKPFSPRELTARIKAVLRRTRNNQKTGRREKGERPVPFEIDDVRLVISYFGTVLQLSRYEFKILQVLIDRPGRVYSREKLMELVWEEPEASLGRTVDTHIKTIRAKLKAIIPDKESIITHRGLGYSLREEW